MGRRHHRRDANRPASDRNLERREAAALDLDADSGCDLHLKVRVAVDGDGLSHATQGTLSDGLSAPSL